MMSVKGGMLHIITKQYIKILNIHRYKTVFFLSVIKIEDQIRNCEKLILNLI